MKTPPPKHYELSKEAEAYFKERMGYLGYLLKIPKDSKNPRHEPQVIAIHQEGVDFYLVDVYECRAGKIQLVESPNKGVLSKKVVAAQRCFTYERQSYQTAFQSLHNAFHGTRWAAPVEAK